MTRKLPITENKDTVFFLTRLGAIFCAFCFFVPLVNIALRLIDYSFLLKISLGGIVAMNPVSAICMMLLAVALWIIRKEHHPAGNKIISDCICVIVMLFGLSKLITLLFDLPFGLDEHLFEEQLMLPESYLWESKVNEVSPNSALSFFLLSISVILIDKRSTQIYKSPELINYLLIFISLIAIYGYVYKVRNLYIVLGIIPMSFHSAMCFFLLSSAVLFLRPYKGSMMAVIGQSPTEVFMMRFFALVIPLFIGWLKIKGEEASFFSEEYGTALFAASTFVISMTLLGWKSSIQYKLNTENKKKLYTIQEERKNFEHILEQSPTIINIIDLESGKIVFTNEAGKEAFDEKIGLVHQNFTEFLNRYVYKEDKESVAEYYKKLSDISQNDFLDTEFRLTDSEDNIYWVLSRAIVFRRHKGKPREIMINALDRTKEKEKEGELQKKNEEMEVKNKELTEARKKLERLNKELESKVKQRFEELVERERRYHYFVELSFRGIVQFEVKDIDGIDITLPVEKQIKLIDKHAVIAQINKEMLNIYGIKKREDAVGKPIDFMLASSDEKKMAFIKKFIEADYQLHDILTEIKDMDGNTFKVKENHIGIIENNNLVRGWSIQVKV